MILVSSLWNPRSDTNTLLAISTDGVTFLMFLYFREKRTQEQNQSSHTFQFQSY